MCVCVSNYIDTLCQDLSAVKKYFNPPQQFRCRPVLLSRRCFVSFSCDFVVSHVEACLVPQVLSGCFNHV